jgi:hypothetical protein
MAELAVACVCFAVLVVFARMTLWSLALIEFGRAAVSGADQPSAEVGGELTRERETFESR